METELDVLAKSALISFFDDDKAISRMALSDIDYCYSGPEITYVFQNVSIVFSQIFIGMVSAYLFYKLYQKRDDEKSRQQLQERIEDIIKSHKNDLEYKIKLLEEKMLAKIDESNELQKKRTDLYIKKAKLMNEDNIDNLIKILETEFTKGPKKQKEHVSRFRDK